MTGSSSGVGISEMRHRRVPFFSCHPVRIGDSLWSYTMTLFFCKNNFAIGVVDGSEADKGMVEGGNELSGPGEVSG